MRIFLAALSLAISTSAPAAEADLRSVAGMQFHERVLLVFAPSLADRRLDIQRAEFAKFGVGAAERDLSFVQADLTHVIGATDKADRLRAKFRIPPDAYRTLLIGKDGRVALALDGPIDATRLAQTIDAMPMRQDEVRRARAGKPLPKS